MHPFLLKQRYNIFHRNANVGFPILTFPTCYLISTCTCGAILAHARVACIVRTERRAMRGGGRGSLILVFLPALDLEGIAVVSTNGFDEGTCKTNVGHQRNIVVDCSTTDAVAVG